MKAPPLSVFATMGDVLRLAWKHPRIVLGTSMAVSLPTIVSGLADTRLTGMFPSFVLFAIQPPLLVIIYLIDAAQRAAIIGLLAEPEPALAWAAMRQALRTRTLTLIRVTILLMLIAIPFGIVVGIIAASVLAFQKPFVATLFSIVLGVLFLVFLKYSLADPLVVARNTGAFESLRISWHMTKGHFGYVACCYLLLGGCMVVIEKFLTPPDYDGPVHALLADACCFIYAVIGTLWVILAWCMYLRIGNVDRAMLAAKETSVPGPMPEAGS
jgi:hypothetical protein